MHGKNTVLKNYIYNMIFMVLKMFIPLVTTPYVSRVLLADGIGTISYIESIASYFVLFSAAGIEIYGRREISYVSNSPEKRSISFWNIKIFEVCTALMMLLIYAILCIRMNSIIGIVFGLNIIAVAFDVSWFYQGMEDFREISLKNIIFKLLNMFFIFAFVKTKDDLLLYAIGITVFPLICNISFWFNLKKYLVKVPIKAIKPFNKAKEIWALFIPTIAIQVYTILDKTMIGLITNSRYENGYYEQSMKVITVILSVITALSAVIVPKVAFLYKNNQMDKVVSYVEKGDSFILMIAFPIVSGLIVISKRFVPIFYGKGYDQNIVLLMILSPLIVAIGVSNITSHVFLIPTGKEKIFTRSVILGACINFVCNLVLIRYFYSLGAAIASVIAETFIAGYQLKCVDKDLDVKHIIALSRNYIIGSIVMGTIIYMEHLLFPSGFIPFILIVISGIICYFIMLLVLRDVFFMDNCQGLLNRFVKKNRGDNEL